MAHKLSSQAVRKLSGQVVHKLSSQAVHKLSGEALQKSSSQAAHELRGHPAVNPISAGSHGTLCSGLWSGSFSVFPPSHPLFFFLSLFHQCDMCLRWGLMAGLRGFVSHGGSKIFYLGAGWPQWKPLGIPGTHLPT